MERIELEDLTVTVVEPSVMQGRVIVKHLSELGITKVQYYPSGTDALSGISRFPPDLVISAMYLPDMTATELVLELRNNSAFADILFMLVSSETSARQLDPIRQAGVVSILPKPFSREDLQRALANSADWLNPGNDVVEEIHCDEIVALVTDDSPLARKQICRVLRSVGITSIDEVPNGAEAVKMLQKKFYDLVVTDYNMPEMDGEALTRFIRENSSQRTIPILAVTSEQNEQRLALIQQAGVSGICDKPFDIDNVRALIHKLLKSAVS